MTDEPQPWERQAGETGAAYDLFAIYRDLGPTRTLIAAVRKRYNGKDCRTSAKRWAQIHRWHERCLAYDRNSQRIQDEAEAEKLAEERVQAARERLELGREIVKKCLERVRVVQVDEIPMGAVAQLAKAGADIARIEDGLSTEQIDAAVRVVTARDLSDDELAHIAAGRRE